MHYSKKKKKRTKYYHALQVRHLACHINQDFKLYKQITVETMKHLTGHAIDNQCRF